MGRKRRGSVLRYGDAFRAFVGREYLGTFHDADYSSAAAAEQAAWDDVRAALQIDAGTARDLLAVYGAAWFDKRERAGLVAGVDRERLVWDRHVKTAPFGRWPMKAIKPRHVQSWIGALLQTAAVHAVTLDSGEVVHRPTGRTLSRQTVVHARRILYACLEQARIEGKIASNPAAGVKVPKVARIVEDEDTWAYLTPAEIERLFAVLPSARLRAFYSVAIFAGLRAGELLGLRWADVVLDGDAPHLKIRRSFAGATKTAGSRREVPLLPVPNGPREALRAWRQEARSAPVVSADGLVWPASDGGCHATGYDAEWTDHRQRAGERIAVREGWRSKAKIRAHVRLHDLRHTCGSHLRMGTWGRAWELHEIMAWLGHSDIKTTLRYAHLSPDNLHGRVRELARRKDRKR